VLTQETLDPSVECTSGILGGEDFSITRKLSLKRSIEHIRYSRTIRVIRYSRTIRIGTPGLSGFVKSLPFNGEGWNQLLEELMDTGVVFRR
jgi:hypothetical protein